MAHWRFIKNHALRSGGAISGASQSIR
ncbi:MAG: hypothetical protein LBN00_05745 [Oscillospiraceae bacterium]|nr:hypothetical protein [Oscillospiraceae bacterium]